jgi:hypothetical protein
MITDGACSRPIAMFWPCPSTIIEHDAVFLICSTYSTSIS